jgi:NUDIX domain
MSKITESSIIIKDDFDNIFIIRKKSKRNEPKLWYLVSRRLRGKEDGERCINRAIKEDLKTIIFNLDVLGEIEYSGEEICLLYKGEIKERPVLGKDIVESRWISKNEIENFDFAPQDKEKILYFFNK